MLAQRARDNLAAVAFCALVGGQDELVFDGHSLVVDHDGRGRRARAAVRARRCWSATSTPSAAGAARLRDTRHRAPAARDGAPARRPTLARFTRRRPPTRRAAPAARDRAAARRASPRSTRRSCSARATTSRKNGFEHVVLGLSGGIDSALVALIAVDALGAERRHRASTMPSPLLLERARSDDARTLAEQPRHRAASSCRSSRRWRAYDALLADVFAGREPDLTEENLQARIRGNLLMALSNKFGWLVLTTGNKSEMSVGYSTLYGDIAGGFAVIKDVPEDARLRARRASATSAPAADPCRRTIVDAPAVGRAAPRPARRRLAAALRGARPDPRGLRRAGPRPRAARSRAGFDADDVDRVIRARRPRRVQAPPGAARHQDHDAAPSAATAACRSPTATAAERRTRRDRAARQAAAAARRSSSASARTGARRRR